MPIFDPKKVSEYKVRVAMSFGVLVLIGIAAVRTENFGPGFWEMATIGISFATASIAHSCWAIWNSSKPKKSPLKIK